MIAKISSGKNFYGAANYNQQKVNSGQATILYTQKLRSTSPKSLENSFERLGNSKVSKPVFHASLSFANTDKAKLTDSKMLELTKEYLTEMGYDKQPYIVYRHNDTAHPHVHILTSRIDFQTQKKLPDNFEHRKSKKITDDLEIKHDLTISDTKVVLRKEMSGVIKEVMQKTKPENLKNLNKELRKINSPIQARSTGRGIVYYKTDLGSEKQKTQSIKSSSFKSEGLDKHGLEKDFASNRKDRLYVKGSVEKVLAKSDKINAIAFAQELRTKDIGTDFKYGKSGAKEVIGVNYTYKEHTYKGSTLDRSLSFNKTKEQLDFPNQATMDLRRNLNDNVASGKGIDMEFNGKEVVFKSANPELNKQLKALPQKEAIDLSNQMNKFSKDFEHADFDGKKIIKGMAENNVDEYLQKRYKYKQRENERQHKR